MLYLAKVMTKGALLRNESRGAHYKPDFQERDDENFLKRLWQNLTQLRVSQLSRTKKLTFH